MADFPVSIRDVDASWITETMRSAGELRNGAVTGFEIEPIGLGVGIMGLLYRLRLRYDAEGAGPASVVLKQPTDGPGARHVAEIFRFYEKEVGFYRDFAAHSPFVTPTCFMARHDSATDDFVLLLADVTDGQVHSQIDGCPPDAAHLAARALARHHAAFADSPRFAEPGNAWLPFASDSPTPEGVIQGVADARGPFREKFPEHATPELEARLQSSPTVCDLPIPASPTSNTLPPTLSSVAPMRRRSVISRLRSAEEPSSSVDCRTSLSFFTT